MSSSWESGWAFGVLLSDDGNTVSFDKSMEELSYGGSSEFPGYMLESIGDPYERIIDYILIPVTPGYDAYTHDPEKMIAFATDEVKADLVRVADLIAERYGLKIISEPAWQDYMVYL